jgi:hypothetical protein
MPLTKACLLIVLIISDLYTLAQVRWSGLGGDGQWLTATNWVGNMVPGNGDAVLLDNTMVSGNYVVTLPAGNSTATVQSLTISPAADNAIEVVLPNNNTASPGFTCTGSGNGLVIHKGGIFRNASGAGSGTPFSIAGVVWIGNGGRYIHNTPRSHVNIVAALATASGTETGIFEFDISNGSPLIAFPGRTFGTLVLSAIAASGAKTYNANGVNRALIRGDFIIGEGVSFNLDLDDTVFIKGNYEQQGGVFNLGSSNNTIVQINNHFIQSAGVITEDDNGLPVIELNGSNSQSVTASGSISNSVTFKINNPAGVILQTPLSLPYKLELTQGKVTTSAINLLTLEAGCTIEADSLSSVSFINGPLQKRGLVATGQFLFPVGKGNSLRWLSLTNVTGNYTVEFFRENPQLMSNAYPAIIHHISSIEHWGITADALPASQAQVKLSFNDPNSGGVTDLSALRVAQLTGGAWANAGNTGYMGTPGSNGFVTSDPISSFGPSIQYFTLASTSATSNPLLLRQRPYTVSGPTIPTVLLAPSLTTGFTKLMITARKEERLHLVIAGSSGRAMMTIPVYLQKGSNTIPLNVAMLPAGIYTIMIPGMKEMAAPVRLIKL